MRILNLTFLVLVAVLFSSCVSKQSVLERNYETKKILLTGKVLDVEIIDERLNVTSDKIKLPTISFPGQFNKVSPILNEDQKQLIINQIKAYFSNSDPDVKVRCHILVGFQEFSAHTFHEREYVQFDTKIELLDSGDRLIKDCTSTAFFELKSLDANYKYIDKIYTKALRTAIYKCFAKLTD